MKSMNIVCRALALAVLAAAAAPWCSAQQATSAPPAREYKLQALYRASIAQSYEFVEQTTVERTYRDSTKATYARTATFFVTVRCIEALDGVSKVVVNLDSLIYKFTSDGKDVTYDSQKDITPKNFADLNGYIGPLNRSFELTYSPYGEVTSLSGEQIDFWRDYLEQNSADLDTLTYTIWMQSLSKENLLQVGDLQKRTIPGLRKAVDSTWKHQLAMRVDGTLYSGSVRSRLAAYEGGLYNIITQDTLAATPGQLVHAYNVPQVATVLDGSVLVNNTILLSSAGTINDFTSVIKGKLRLKAGREPFEQSTTTTYQWKLVGQYQW